MPRPTSTLEELNPDKIDRNPDNPRLIFREDEMNQLLESIRKVGIKVPLSVYQKNGRYALIDGERRWRCAKKLNLRLVPAHVQPRPTPLENLLMMFNIHNVRVDWDPMLMALKLGEIRAMLAAKGEPTEPKALAAVTGMRLATVKRGFELLDLPRKYQKLLLKEAEKPRSEQKITADLFLEIYKSLHAIERHLPEALKDISKPKYVDAMVKKYRQGVIDNVVAYREVSKIARAELAGADRRAAIPTILRLVNERTYSIKQAYQDTVQAAYEQRDLLTKVRGLIEKLSGFGDGVHFDKETREALEALKSEIERVLT